MTLARRHSLLLALSVALAACVPLPPLVTDTQVRATLPAAHHEAGMRCAARLNDHVRGTRGALLARPLVLSAGALLAGTGIALNEAAPDASLPLTAAGAIVSLVAEVVVRLIADPADLLTRYARGRASFDAAREDPDAAGPLLEGGVMDREPARARLPVLSGGVAP